MTDNEKTLLANTRDPKIPTIFIPCAHGATVKDADTDLTHKQKQFIFSLEHGVNKGHFTSTIEELRWSWTRGWWAVTPFCFDEVLRAKFDACNNN